MANIHVDELQYPLDTVIAQNIAERVTKDIQKKAKEYAEEYIDDTLGDLDNIDNYVIGAIYDNYVKTQELIGITEEGQYFNSGVLLIDVKKWIEQNVIKLNI